MPIATPLSVPTLPATNGMNGSSGGGDAKKLPLPNGVDYAKSPEALDEAADLTQQQPKYTSTSYPSNCLNFLQNVPSRFPSSPSSSSSACFTAGAQASGERTKHSEHGHTAETPVSSAKVKLDVLVVGAGLGGLATAIALRRRGHDVTVFEQAPELMEVGAGIQVPPNSGKLLQRWGVMRHLDRYAVHPARMNFRRWQNGALIGVTDTSPAFTAQYGAAYSVVHRAHLHHALYQQAVALGVRTRLNSKVDVYDAETATIVLADGAVFQGDLVVAADGVKSLARSLVSPSGRGVPKPTGFAVYRATVDVEKMKQYPELHWILENPNLNLWIGEDRHVMTYCIAGGQSFNMVLSHRDKGDPALFGMEEDILGDIRKEFDGWDSQLTTIISLIEKAMKTPLMSGAAPLDKWVAPSGKLVILGDAAHAMVPYMSQGAAMAVEDGAALATVLSQIPSSAPQDLKFALGLFEKERVRRSSQMQEASMVNSMIWHFRDGPLQEARDAAMRPEVEGRHFLSSPNQWSDPVTQNWAYGYDAESVMKRAWDEAVHELILTSHRP